MHDTSGLIACHHCDALYRKRPLAPGERADCARCGAELYRNTSRQLARLLPLTLSALIVFVIANAFPIVQMDIQGITNSTTLWGAVLQLYRQDMPLVSVLVFATTLAAPLVELGALAYLLVPLNAGRVPPGFDALLRLMNSSRPWGMIEVFLLGVLVALVKLSAMASIVPGVALWAFGALTVLLAAILSVDLRYLWDWADDIRAANTANTDAAAQTEGAA